MSVIVGIVSHGHDNLLEDGRLNVFREDKDIELIIYDNLNSKSLSDFCSRNNITYLAREKKHGFGSNNNYIFDYASKKFDFDYFFVCNPDINISKLNLDRLHNKLKKNSPEISTIRLFDTARNMLFENVRRFPKISSLVRSILLNNKKGYIYHDSERENLRNPDWCSGCFLVIKSDVFSKLKGFDDRYFMYMEDIDICLRARALFGIKVIYFNDIVADHPCAYRNRNLKSKHFLWHMNSAVKYFWRNRKLKIFLE